MLTQGRAVWDAESSTLVFSGDVLDNNEVSFAITTEAGLSDTSGYYYVSIQQSVEHLRAIELAELSVSESR
jgi:hypothetical protein